MSDSPTPGLHPPQDPSPSDGLTRRVDPPLPVDPSCPTVASAGERASDTRRGDPRASDGEPFGRYLLLSELGRGGMGIVYRAWDTQLQRLVALKMILSEGGLSRLQVERFLREARVAARLRHPHVVGVLDTGEHEGRPYLTTEYVEARRAEQSCIRSGPCRRGGRSVAQRFSRNRLPADAEHFYPHPRIPAESGTGRAHRSVDMTRVEDGEAGHPLDREMAGCRQKEAAMSKVSTAMALSCVVALGLVFPGCSGSRDLRVESSPGEAGLSVNGQHVGTTPATQRLKLDDENARWDLMVEKQGYEAASCTITQAQAKAAPDPWVKSFTLEPLTATLDVQFASEPDGAAVSVSGGEALRAPCTASVRFARPSSHSPWSNASASFSLEHCASVTIPLAYEDLKNRTSPVMARLDLADATLQIRFESVPGGAMVSLDGAAPVATPVTLPVRFTRSSRRDPWSAPRAEFRMDRYAPHAERLSYEALQADPVVRANLLEVHREVPVLINTNVESATVKVDGKEVGVTPLRRTLVFARNEGEREWSRAHLEVSKEGYRCKAPDGGYQPAYSRLIGPEEAAAGTFDVKLDQIQYYTTRVRELVVGRQGIEIKEEEVLSQAVDIEKQPKVHVATRITDYPPDNPFLVSRISALSDGSIMYSLPMRKPGSGELIGSNIWIRTGNATTRVTDGAYFDIDATISPDGANIYFSSNRLGTSTLWRTSTKGVGGLTLIVSSPFTNDTQPALSPDNSKIAYTSAPRESNGQSIWTVGTDGRLPAQLREGSSPAWSPDGKHIAYEVPDRMTGHHKVWIMDSDGGNPTQLTTGADVEDRFPVWLPPDGEKIVYASNRALNEEQKPNYDIWMMSKDGTVQTQLTVNGSLDTRPAVSPDGKYIYFISNRGARKEGQETLQIWRIEL